jgi:hypothetical protein
MNERQVLLDGEALCRACAEGAYYEVLGSAVPQTAN